MFKIVLDISDSMLVMNALRLSPMEGSQDLLQFFEEALYLHEREPEHWNGSLEIRDTERKLAHAD